VGQVTSVEHGTFSRGLGLMPQRYILFVARFVPEKGADILLRAFSRIRTDIKLVLVGDSTFSTGHADRVRQLARKDARVILTGFVYGTELAELFTNATMFVTPSLIEGMPLTLLTAAAYRLPIVASDIPAHSEFFGSSSIGHRLVPAGDSLALAGAIEATLQDLNATRWSARVNRDRVLSHYDWDEAALQTEQIYRKALADNERRGFSST
jgi:glycosyltransferase involved in cell wall biosynthesis